MATYNQSPSSILISIFTVLLAFMAAAIYAAGVHPGPFAPKYQIQKPSKVLSAQTLPLPVSLHKAEFGVLVKGRLPPSGPSHRGHKKPNFTRHLLWRSDRSFQDSHSRF
ncbi:hypothetical protein U1Q18_009386 [Sarracenia purpurea var. burkii]